MAAGLGFKTFVSGEVLTAAEVNGYLNSQTVMVFADAAARTAAITSPQEGMISYLKDTDATQYYSGSAWVNVGGGSPLTTKGDLYTYSTADARLAVGANDTVLTADSTAATGLKWAAVASGGMTLLASGTLSGANVTLSSIPATYKDLVVYMRDPINLSQNVVNLRLNGDTTVVGMEQRISSATYQAQPVTAHGIFQNLNTTNTDNHAYILIPDYAAASKTLAFSQSFCNTTGSGTGVKLVVHSCFTNNTTAIDTVALNSPSQFNGGTYELWGCK